MEQSIKIIFVFLLSLLLHLVILHVPFGSGNFQHSRYQTTEIGLVSFATAHKTVKAVSTKAALQPSPVMTVGANSSALSARKTVNQQLPSLVKDLVLPTTVVAPVDGTMTSEIVNIEKTVAVEVLTAETYLIPPIASETHSEMTGNISERPALIATTGVTEELQAIPRYEINPRPVYPDIALRKGWEGLVLLRVEVKKNGLVERLEIEKSSGFNALDQAALKAVRRWRFVPAMSAGLPVECGAMVPIRFDLP